MKGHKTPFNAIGLIRVACIEQTTINKSIETQSNLILNYAHVHGMCLEKVYFELGKSGNSHEFMERIFQEIDKKIVTPKTLIVECKSRLSRSMLNLDDITNQLKTKNISLTSVTEPTIDTTHESFITESIISFVNKLHSKAHSKYIQDSLNNIVKQGYFPGGRIPFGYSSITVKEIKLNRLRHKLIVNPEEALIVIDIFEFYRSIRSSSKVAKQLNDSGRRNRGKLWTCSMIKKILNNPIYCGRKLWGKKRKTNRINNLILLTDTPSIISKEVFDDAQNSGK